MRSRSQSPHRNPPDIPTKARRPRPVTQLAQQPPQRPTGILYKQNNIIPPNVTKTNAVTHRLTIAIDSSAVRTRVARAACGDR